MQFFYIVMLVQRLSLHLVQNMTTSLLFFLELYYVCWSFWGGTYLQIIANAATGAYMMLFRINVMLKMECTAMIHLQKWYIFTNTHNGYHVLPSADIKARVIAAWLAGQMCMTYIFSGNKTPAITIIDLKYNSVNLSMSNPSWLIQHTFRKNCGKICKFN